MSRPSRRSCAEQNPFFSRMKPSRWSVCACSSSARASASGCSRRVLTRTVPRRVSRRCAEDSAETSMPSTKPSVTVSEGLRTVRRPVLCCSAMSWRMSASEKSRSVPSSAMSGPPRADLAEEPSHQRNAGPEDQQKRGRRRIGSAHHGQHVPRDQRDETEREESEGDCAQDHARLEEGRGAGQDEVQKSAHPVLGRATALDVLQLLEL